MVIHAGNGVWFVIDSCTVPETDEPRSVRYLTDIGVDVTSHVKRIIATHWDDDHIRGLSRLVELAKDAEFVCSGAVFTEDFATLVRISNSSRTNFAGGVREFGNVFDTLKKRGKQLKLVMAQTTIWNCLRNGQEDAALIALSPSTATIIDGHLNIAQLVRGVKSQNLRPVDTSRNARSIVLWLRIQNALALLV